MGPASFHHPGNYLADQIGFVEQRPPQYFSGIRRDDEELLLLERRLSGYHVQPLGNHYYDKIDCNLLSQVQVLRFHLPHPLKKMTVASVSSSVDICGRFFDDADTGAATSNVVLPSIKVVKNDYNQHFVDTGRPAMPLK